MCSPAVWFGVIFIRHGLYQDGVFKFTVYIPDNYPDGDCPVSGTAVEAVQSFSHFGEIKAYTLLDSPPDLTC